MTRSTIAVFLILAAAICTCAQSKPPVPPTDYGQWESLATLREYGGLSPDGKWLAYGINRSNRNNELRVTNIAGGTTKTIAFGAQPAFSLDSRWAAYSIGIPEFQEEKLKKDKKPVPKKIGLLNLSTGELSTIDSIESFAFSPDGAWLAMRHTPPEKKDSDKKDSADTSDSDEVPVGAILLLRQLSTGRDTSFGNVSEYAWQDLPKTGTLLAMTINTEDKTGNGVQVFDVRSAAVRVLDTSASIYSGLSWRKKSSDLAVLRSKSDDHRDGPTQVALAWTNLGKSSESAHLYDPTADSKFPAATRTVSFHKPDWALDGGVVFLGLAKWEDKISEPAKSKTPAADGAKSGDGANADGTANDSDSTKRKDKEDDDPPTVDVWNWHDTEVMPRQKLNAKDDRRKNMLAAWHLEKNSLVPLGKDLDERVAPLKHQTLAVSADWSAYAMERSIGRPAADISLVDLFTGARSKIQDGLNNDYYLEESPGGQYILYFRDDNYWTVNTATHAVVSITKGVQTSFVDRESDFTIRQKPAFGVAGWTKDDAAVILYDKFDLWQVAPDGSRAIRLTDGAANQVRHRYEKLDPEEEWIDTSMPLYLSLFGIWTKKSGFARLKPGPSGALTEEHLLWLDKGLDHLAKAQDADVFEYVQQTFVESPNVFITSPDLKDAKAVTKTNPFQSNYAWGREELVEYKNSHNERLQGALFYPAGYEPAKKYPMIVYMYEKLSDNLHRYSPASERNYYNVSAMNAHGYFVLEPDILFKPRDPGISVADCVTAAAKRVIQMGVIDPKRIGIMGHSWGGFDTTYLATHVTNFFAAGVAGAPITDLVSNYGNHHWSIGIAETDHIETGQQRMEVPLYEDLQAYIRNSAVFAVSTMTTPLLIEVGDSDGTVFFHQGVELYNIARRAKKEVVLIEYAGEDHGLRKKANQIDYQRRIFQWFGHYLKDEPAADWITKGETYLTHERELRKLKSASSRN
ncbi:MAG TPA: prolyl oligopeptidase family serine peptidase [Candidatus Acidoferrum sp.]|nr:prolyl oligopeptidase family serine peptidase [Candidatus Acidoferrum sp.]